MSELAPYPKSAGGKWKRRRNDELELITGQRYCTSCHQLRPREEVKLYRASNGRQSLPRCNVCQQRRLEAMRK